jgi:hypothetical protein
MDDDPDDYNRFAIPIFLGAAYQNVKNTPIDHKTYQMVVKYTNIVHSKVLQNIPKLGSGNP